jgi:excisionase family DNA binding protein
MARPQSITDDPPRLPFHCPQCEKPIWIAVLLTEDEKGAWGCNRCGTCSRGFNGFRERAPRNGWESQLQRLDLCVRGILSPNLLHIRMMQSSDRSPGLTLSQVRQGLNVFRRKWFERGDVKANEIEWLPSASLLENDEALIESNGSESKIVAAESEIATRVANIFANPSGNPTMSRDEVAHALGQSESTVRRLVLAGELRATKSPSRIQTRSVMEYIENEAHE